MHLTSAEKLSLAALYVNSQEMQQRSRAATLPPYQGLEMLSFFKEI
jgi:hypothetical protein